jgi:hypothetical protein
MYIVPIKHNGTITFSLNSESEEKIKEMNSSGKYRKIYSFDTYEEAMNFFYDYISK